MAGRTDSGLKTVSPQLAIVFPEGKPLMVGGVRQGLVAHAQANIRAGVYDDPNGDAMEGAIDALIANEGQEPAGRR